MCDYVIRLTFNLFPGMAADLTYMLLINGYGGFISFLRNSFGFAREGTSAYLSYGSPRRIHA